MAVQHESRSGTDRRKFNLHLKPGSLADRRWHKDQRAPVMNDDSLYNPDWEVSDSDLEAYAKISLDD